MKTLGEAAMDLPWIAPSVASLTALAQEPLSANWSNLRTDPGFVLLFARTFDADSSDHESVILDAVLRQQSNFSHGFVDWGLARAAGVRRDCFRLAYLASQLAKELELDESRAWLAGFLAPLGWLAIAACEPDAPAWEKTTSLAGASGSESASWQRQAWGIDHTALARRLSRSWRLPAWLAAIISHLGLHVNIAERLGAAPRLFQVVQLSIGLLQARSVGLGLPVGGDVADLLGDLQLDAEAAAALADAAHRAEPPSLSWQAPGESPLLADLLRLALEHRRSNDSQLIERLQQELDRMQETLVEQCAGERNRLHTQKLSALAEFAAGAGHEINNPLAVISGQAQYVLKQLDWLDGPAEEIENIGEYLDNLRGNITLSLRKIIGQTQRIHTILTDLMQFARPGPARVQALAIADVIHEAAESLQALAQQRNVRIIEPESACAEYVSADPAQVRLALASLMRNAIEAAPAGGWAAIRVERSDDETLEMRIEDNGPGPAPAIREHLFDPFFSGRSAGRGRGLGLATAWRLARQQGGNVRFDGVRDGVTRFVLALRAAEAPAFAQLGGYQTEPVAVKVVHPPLAG